MALTEQALMQDPHAMQVSVFSLTSLVSDTTYMDLVGQSETHAPQLQHLS